MIAKVRRNIIDRKLFTGIIVFAGIFVITVGSIIAITVFGGNTSTSPIPTEVVLNGKTYTKTNPFVILEIVPLEGLGELGYMVGGDSMPILSADIQKITNGTNKTAVLNAWKDCVGCITGIWDRTKYSDDGLLIAGFGDRNLFANSVFGNSDMTDKILVKSVAAGAVTKDMVDSANMVYINPGYHAPKFYEAYNLMAQYTSGNNNLSKKYNTVSTNAKFSQYNISAIVALEIYIRSEEHGLSVVYDNSQTVWSNTSQNENDNYSKLGQLLLSIEPDTFVTEYASQYVSGIYSGTRGTIGVYNSVLQIKRNSANVNWDCYMFVENHTPKYPYFNGGTRNSLYLNQNVLSYSGYNLMDMIFLGGGSTKTDSDGGTDFNIARSLYGTKANGELTYTNMTRYIIGDFPSNEDFPPINVLEIEPSGAYKYKTYENAKKIVSYLGYDTSKMTTENWTDYVKITSVASNGFNGMSEDIAEKYDLIIVGSNNPIGYLKTPTIYSSKGEEIIIRGISTSTKARFSGNDLTLKSVEKLTTYAETGKPMLFSQDLYYSTKNIDSSANIYKLGIVKLRAELVKVGVSDRNIMHEPSDGASYRYMLRMVKPVITISDKFKMKYSANVATTTILSNEISNLKFDGTIGTTAKTYNLVVTVDKNSNGLFAAESSDETNEVCYKGNVTTAADGKFDIILNLPESARGYMAWKAVATDISTNLSSQDLGGFVIEVKAEDIKTVKLLQILPNGTPITLNMKTNTQFQNLFSQVETVSGIKLDVTTMTTRNYEDMYKNGNTYTSGNYDTNNMLKNYSMVVLGFSDAYCYDDISNANGALDNLYDYIGKNNSVLFVHDTMSFASYSDGSSTTDKGKAISGSTTWGFQLTNKFRYLIGMDRYGASLNKGLGDSIQGYTNDFLLRFARTSSGNAYSIFTNIATYTSNNLTEVVNRLNQGQVTEFPYATGETLSISPTHAQYFQLDLEGHSDINKDIVVWYTLGANTSKYAASKLYDYTGQDALNNYYIYSKGNITYSGAGHSDVTSVSELKLFVNTVIKAILSGNSVPQIEVHNAATVSSGKYDLFTRDNTMLPMIEFTPSDTDLSKYTGVFESGLVYWDVDGSGTYNTGDVNLKVYDSNSKLKNEQMVTLDLQLYKDIKNASGDTMRKCFDNNELKIGIQATDACQSMGYANVSVKYRNLFNLN